MISKEQHKREYKSKNGRTKNSAKAYSKLVTREKGKVIRKTKFQQKVLKKVKIQRALQGGKTPFNNKIITECPDCDSKYWVDESLFVRVGNIEYAHKPYKGWYKCDDCNYKVVLDNQYYIR